VDEPYRLFTSRAEFRLLLRQDNAPARLGPRARDVGLLTRDQARALGARLEERRRIVHWVRETTARPETVNGALERAGSSPLGEPVRVADLLRRPGVSVTDLAGALEEVPFDPMSDLAAAVEVELKYEGYVQREEERARRLREQAAFLLPEDLPYEDFATLSREARDKLGRVRPGNLAQAGRIPGVSPADLQNLLLEVKRRKRRAVRTEVPAEG
jgi:tRNA uridine 5-carboxymethylaminomethyl modification enzyme